MTLAEFLLIHQLTPAEFARRIGVNRMTVHRYVKRTRVPIDEHKEKIYHATGGLVQPNDFYDFVEKDHANDNRRRFCWERVDYANEPDPEAELEELAREIGVSKPVAYAVMILRERVTVLRHGYFLLDGRKVATRDIIAAANTELTKQGKPIIAFPGLTDPDADVEYQQFDVLPRAGKDNPPEDDKEEDPDEGEHEP